MLTQNTNQSPTCNLQVGLLFYANDIISTSIPIGVRKEFERYGTVVYSSALCSLNHDLELCSLNHDPELCSSSFTFGSENKLSLHSLNHDPELCSSSFTFGSENKLSLHSLNHDLD